MLHILWLIIRGILILLGILIGLVLLLVLLFLFCPVRYRGRIKKEGASGIREAEASGEVSWLFRGISIKVVFQKGKPETEIYILGLAVSKLKKIFHKKKKNSAAEKHRNISSEQQETNRQKKKAALEKTESPKVIQKPFAAEAEEGTDAAAKIQPEDEKPQNENKFQRKPGSLISKITERIKIILRNLAGTIRNISAIPGKIQKKIRNFTLTIKKFCDNINRWREFIDHPRTRAAFSLVWKDAKRLLRHVLPTRITGNITFGSEDPAVTGTVLAVLGMTIPFHKNKIAVNPLFDGENFLEGEVRLKGRIYGVMLLKTAAELYFNKNIKYVIHRWRHKEVNHGERQ